MSHIERPARSGSEVAGRWSSPSGSLATGAERLLGLAGAVLSALGSRPAGVIGSVFAIACALLPLLVAGVRRVGGVGPPSSHDLRDEELSDDKK